MNIDILYIVTYNLVCASRCDVLCPMYQSFRCLWLSLVSCTIHQSSLFCKQHPLYNSVLYLVHAFFLKFLECSRLHLAFLMVFPHFLACSDAFLCILHTYQVYNTPGNIIIFQSTIYTNYIKFLKNILDIYDKIKLIKVQGHVAIMS